MYALGKWHVELSRNGKTWTQGEIMITVNTCNERDDALLSSLKASLVVREVAPSLSSLSSLSSSSPSSSPLASLLLS
jgi:hypothetical protein